MKKIMLFALMLVLLFTVSSLAQTLTREEQTMIRDAVIKMLKIDSVRIESPALKKVFAGPFFSVKLARTPSPGTSYGMGKLLLAKIGDSIVEPEGTMTGRSMPNLKSTIQKDFRLKTRTDAETLQTALDSVYSITSSSDKKAKAIIQNGDEWIFVRGNFFKKKKGFIFTVKNGVITRINYSLGIIIDK